MLSRAKSSFVLILGDSPTSHSRSYQLPMLMPCQLQAAAGGQNVIGGLLTLTVSRLVLGLSVYPVLENQKNMNIDRGKTIIVGQILNLGQFKVSVQGHFRVNLCQE